MSNFDSILIQNGRAHQIWRGIAKADLPPMTAEFMAATVEAPSDTVNEGDVWDGAAFVAPTPPPRTVIPYAEFRGRLTDAEAMVWHAKMIANWRVMDFTNIAVAQNAVHIGSAAALAVKAEAIAEGILTAERADIVFS